MRNARLEQLWREIAAYLEFFALVERPAPSAVEILTATRPLFPLGALMPPPPPGVQDGYFREDR